MAPLKDLKPTLVFFIIIDFTFSHVNYRSLTWFRTGKQHPVRQPVSKDSQIFCALKIRLI